MNLNTLEYADKLINAGVPEAQARAQANLLGEIISDNLATKENIKELDLKIETVRADLKRDIKELETKMEMKIETMGSKLTLHIVGYLAAIMAAFMGIMQFINSQ